MKRKILIPALAALAAAALFGACKATDTAGNTSAAVTASKPGAPAGVGAPTRTTTVHADGVRRVDVAELQKMVAAGGVLLYDTRSKMQYDEEHIEGALSLPQNEVEARAGELPRDKTLVFYCTWPAENSSAGAARTLKSKGIEDTAALVGGLEAWKNAGLPTKKKQQ